MSLFPSLAALFWSNSQHVEASPKHQSLEKAQTERLSLLCRIKTNPKALIRYGRVKKNRTLKVACTHSTPTPLTPPLSRSRFSKVWFQNRRMKDKRQRHSLPWPHPLVDPLGALLMSRASTPSGLPYPFIPPHLPHLPLHHPYPLALPSPASSPPHGRYAAPMRTLDAIRLSHYHGRPGGLSPAAAAALYPSTAVVHHPASCPCPLCLHWGSEQLLKARGEPLGLSQPPSPKGKIQPAGLERREEMV